MTTECITNRDIAERHVARPEVTISPTEWGIVAILAVGLLLMLPAATFLVSHFVA